MRPLVSVVIPVHDYAHFLSMAFDSIRDQTLTDWECVIVDDGSTDDTGQLGRRLAAADSRARYVHQPNRGLAAARNTGFAEAGGKYVQFLDADDVLSPAKLEWQVAALEDDATVGVSYTGYQVFASASGEALGRYASLELSADPLQDFLYRWERGLTIPVHCALFRMDLWAKEAPFDESLPAKEDWLMWVRLALAGVKFSFTDQDLCWYRKHTANMTASALPMIFAFARAAEVIASLLPPPDRSSFASATAGYVRQMLDNYLSSAAVVPHPTPQARAAGPVEIVLGRRGSLQLEPTLVRPSAESGATSVTVAWSSNVQEVEIRVGQPDGPLLTRGPSTGRANTGNWVRDGMLFYLQDGSPGRPLTAEHTLALAIARVATVPTSIDRDRGGSDESSPHQPRT